MSTPSLAETTAPSGAGRSRLGSLRWRLTLAVPVLTLACVGLFEWSLSRGTPMPDLLVSVALLTVLLSAVLLALVEALLLRPLRRLADGCEALESSPMPLEAPHGLAPELGRIGDAMRRARGSLWQHDQDVRELRQALQEQRTALTLAEQALEARERELASLTRVDELTGIANLRAFEEALRREFKRAQRQRGLLAVAVIDLDQFKQFNLAFGTAIGDTALKRVAGLLNERFKRDTDLVARLGGEEFVALLPGFGMAEAQGVLESLRDDLRALRLPDGQTDQPLTISVGLAAASPAHPYLSAQALLQAADEALYIAKHSGRDRLSLAA